MFKFHQESFNEQMERGANVANTLFKERKRILKEEAVVIEQHGHFISPADDCFLPAIWSHQVIKEVQDNLVFKG